MTTYIFNGQTFRVRGANNKYASELSNLDTLHEELKIESRDEWCKRKNIPYNSLNYVLRKYFPTEWLKDINVKRKRKLV